MSEPGLVVLAIWTIVGLVVILPLLYVGAKLVVHLGPESGPPALLDPNRARGERPYQDLSDEELGERYRRTTRKIRQAESGYGLSATVDEGWLYSEELRERGIDPETVIDDD